ncbi:TPA: hypothetical protein DDW35_07430 [Candidatus Sumerlaeota bacterium]|nr:hypothetical protein [Candidatus Sumerlaeota bacterium]
MLPQAVLRKHIPHCPPWQYRKALALRYLSYRSSYFPFALFSASLQPSSINPKGYRDVKKAISMPSD